MKLASRIFLFILISMNGIFSSCIPTAGTNNSRSERTSSDDINSDTDSEGGTNFTNTPTDIPTNNSFEIESTLSTIASFPATSTQVGNLRGNDIDVFIKQVTTSVQCLIMEFPSTITKRFLVMALIPRERFQNNDLNTLEKIYTFYPNGEQNNIFCQKSSLVNSLLQRIPEAQIAFKTLDLCPDCFFSEFSSSKIDIYDPSGVKNSAINTDSLAARIQNEIFGTPSGSQCSQKSECTNLGFDCCSVDSICANDLTLKSNINQQSTEFLGVLNIVTNFPARRRDFPQFYNVCPIEIPVETDLGNGQTSSDNLDNDAARLVHLADLYDCTTLIKGEMSLCTKEIDNASTASSTTFTTEGDDRSFATIYSGTQTINQHSIYEVTYSGSTLFKDNSILSSHLKIGANNNLLGNDNLSDPGIIEMTKPKPTGAINDLLRIKYKIDGSCEEVFPGLARCEKYYIQGQNTGDVDDHFPSDNKFILPGYADVNKTVQVLVEDIQRFQGTNWNITATNPMTIEFNGPNLAVFDGQKVVISYFVDTNSNSVLQAKKTALEEIQAICTCADLNCRLEPVFIDKNGKNVISDFGCKYPEADLPPPPLQQVVLMSSKTVPVRLFNETGEAKQDAQYDELAQEGKLFKYTDRDVLKPNNVDEYIGFNEIYGSLTPDPLAAKPAREVRVVQGKVYDIFVETGTFSSCFNCGTDYYSNVARLFPQNFTTVGGGIFPQAGLTNRSNSTGYRSDDLLFGRACWLPVTMIPWSHRADANRQNQRIERMQAQHFQFANGYQRDWYGFDYGSVIGSFDGVVWFSVGNQRRIQAKTNKIFLAVNSYFGDLTTESTFKIVVNESSTTVFSGSQIENDFDSDGAECQKEHICETDTDCITRLGWDYSCQDISLLKTNSPEFDTLANEIPNQSIAVSLRALFNQSKGGIKRCIYRGKGALCHTTLNNLDRSNMHNQDNSVGHQACSENNYCQELNFGNTTQKFNNRIARFAASVNNQNASSKVAESELDSFGLGARTIGRPFAFNGTESIPSEALNNLQNNQVQGMCIPGRNPEATTLEASNFTFPLETHQGDKVLNIGMTLSVLNDFDPQYVSSCSIVDPDSENRIIFDPNFINRALDETTISTIAASQAFSTNHLKKFENILDEDITVQLENRQLTNKILGRNRCLRAPNSTCFSNFDCAPSTFIANFVKRISKGQTSINDQELQFWSEELICSQEKEPEDDGYDHTQNRCCRETQKTVHIPSYKIGLTGSADFDNKKIPGINIELDNKKRYSRNAIVHRETSSLSGNLPYLEGARKDAISGYAGQFDNQWKTFDLTASRTCCSRSWVRNFDSSNGGGHNWSSGKTQRVNKQNFKCYNWSRDVSTPDTNFSCESSDDPDDPDCAVRTLFDSDYGPILEVMERIELTGIPQIKIDMLENASSSIACTSHPESFTGSLPFFMPGIINDNDSDPVGAFSPTAEFISGSTKSYAADDMENFDPSLRKIFSEDTVSCCLPIGTELETGEDKNLCCSGFLDESGEKPRCALPDYTNLSVYFNRYVSSEASGLDDSLFEEDTGYFKNSDSVMELACQVRACASNVIASGIAVVPLKVPGHENNVKVYPRFIDSNSLSSESENSMAELWDEGLRWNTQVYCVPPTFEDFSGDQNTVNVKFCLQ